MNEIIDTTGKNTIEVFHALIEKYHGKLVFTSSFGLEDQVIAHMISGNKLPIKVVTLDTGRLFEETYKVINRTRENLHLPIDTFFPDSAQVEQMLSKKGPLSFYQSIENRKECCHIRKVEPLKRALAGHKVWVTGLRADQSEARHNLNSIEWEPNYQLVKFNPLVNWTLEEVRNYITKNKVPYNPMHDRGFISIGCEPCTRAVAPGEHARAGRWWWESNSQKECGLHSAKNAR